jgi:hypothetical protein
MTARAGAARVSMTSRVLRRIDTLLPTRLGPTTTYKLGAAMPASTSGR